MKENGTEFQVRKRILKLRKRKEMQYIVRVLKDVPPR